MGDPRVWRSQLRAIALLLAVVSITTGARAQSTVPFVAGVEPDRRPASAPVVRDVARDAAWRDRMRRGIEQPYPPTLKFIESQGAWYSPFDRPGMPGLYDIRRLHSN